MFVKSIVIVDESNTPIAAGSGPDLLKSFSASGQPKAQLGGVKIVCSTEDGALIGVNNGADLIKALPVYGKKPV